MTQRLPDHSAQWHDSDMFIGRARVLAQLRRAVDEATTGQARLVLVHGEAGIGKTTLLAEAAGRSGWSVGWGTCADAERAPAFWPWTTALRGLLAAAGPNGARQCLGADAVELARLMPELADPGADRSPDPDDSGTARLRLFDAAAHLLERLAAQAPSMVVLDDLQWADESTIELLSFLARAFRPVPLVLFGAYRPAEPGAEATIRALAEVAAQGEEVPLRGLSRDEVRELVTVAAGESAARRWSGEVHRRTGGHPFFARHLTELLLDPEAPAEIPGAVRDLVGRRVRDLSPDCRALVEAAAVAGGELLPDVLAEVCGTDPATVARLVADGVGAGLLVRVDGGDAGHADLAGAGDDRVAGDLVVVGSRARLAHDLFRETVAASISVPERLELHRRIADALEHRHARGAAVAPEDLARHCAATVPLGGGERAVRWARAAARAERARLAFGEAAAHLARVRRALEDAGTADSGPVLVELLVEEADVRARSGDPRAARTLLDDARDRAVAAGDALRLGRAALGVQALGARFAMPRDAVVEVLDAALAGLDGTGTVLEAQVTAGLARELHHSVPAQRPRAGPLSERAIALARDLDDPDTLAACLLARHDVSWTPGRAVERVGLAREITDLAARSGDAERHAEGLLLTANAQLEAGSAAFRATLADFLRVTEGFGQPRHDYLALTRRAALAVVDGRWEEAEREIEEAAALGERIGEPDTGNVRMSQQLGLVRARGEPESLRATAAEAVSWWVGVPSHAHAVAAGLYALAGTPDDLAAAHRELETVLALDTWRDDRSYLWPVFVGGMATAAARLGDRAVCTELLSELAPVTNSCGVNGALVCFMGSNAHWAGVLASALDRGEEAQRWLEEAMAVHRRLGAPAWEAESAAELAALGGAAPGNRTVGTGAERGPGERAIRLVRELDLQAVAARLERARVGPVGRVPRAGADGAEAELCRDGELWRVRHGDRAVHLPDLKGFSDLAVLLARPGIDVGVLDLVRASTWDDDAGPRLDATARSAYRRRWAELDEDLARAREHHDLERARRLETERAALLAELGRASGLGGRARALGSSTSERARKAVTARVREAIRRIGAAHPELGAHLDRSVLTGTSCRYDPAEPLNWRL